MWLEAGLLLMPPADCRLLPVPIDPLQPAGYAFSPIHLPWTRHAAPLSSSGTSPENASRADPDDKERVELEWRLDPWLCSLQDKKGGGFVSAISEALLHPLQEETEFEATEVDAALELSFLRTLGEAESSDAIYKVLSDGDVLHALSKIIWVAALELISSSANGAGVISKFFEDSDSSIRYGALDTFYQGLGKCQWLEQPACSV